jgi:hypothetical protein
LFFVGIYPRIFPSSALLLARHREYSPHLSSYWQVVINYNSAAEKAEEVAEEVRKLGGEAMVVRMLICPSIGQM